MSQNQIPTITGTISNIRQNEGKDGMWYAFLLTYTFPAAIGKTFTNVLECKAFKYAARQIEKAKIRDGATVQVQGWPKSREFNGKYYTDFYVDQINEMAGAAAPEPVKGTRGEYQQPAGPAASDGLDFGGDDSIPF